MALANHLVSSRFELEEVSRRRAVGVYYGEYRMLCRLLGEYLAFVDTRDFMLAPRLVLEASGKHGSRWPWQGIFSRAFTASMSGRITATTP
jgi:hypothetical protein